MLTLQLHQAVRMGKILIYSATEDMQPLLVYWGVLSS